MNASQVQANPPNSTVYWNNLSGLSFTNPSETTFNATGYDIVFDANHALISISFDTSFQATAGS
jgi:hypothetical protein